MGLDGDPDEGGDFRPRHGQGAAQQRCKAVRPREARQANSQLLAHPHGVVLRGQISGAACGLRFRLNPEQLPGQLSN